MRRDEEFQAMEEQECQFWQNSQFFHEGVNGDAPHHRQRGGWGWGMAPQMPLGYMVSSMLRHHGSFDDRLVLSKHSDIFPDDDSLLVIQKQVLNVEKSLKAVSDNLAVAKGSSQDNRQLKGIMRVGILAKGLLLKCDTTVQLVLLCTHYPTKDLLESVASALPGQLEENAAGATYDVVADVPEAAVVVKVLNVPLTLQIEVLFSSPAVREAVSSRSFPANPLSEEKCLHALAELRQAKWFQVKASMLHSCMIIVRILRDLCLRNDAWRPFYVSPTEIVPQY
jgi:zinc finger RNA-binding protein